MTLTPGVKSFLKKLFQFLKLDTWLYNHTTYCKKTNDVQYENYSTEIRLILYAVKH
jgi:hypothetical protein